VTTGNHQTDCAIIDSPTDYSDNRYKDIPSPYGRPANWQSRYLGVPEEFIRKFPDLSQEKAEKHYNSYLASLRASLLKRLPFTESNYMHLPLKRIGDSMGKFEYKTEKFYIWKEFRDIRPFFNVIEDKKGNGYKKGMPFQKNSEVYIMNQKLLDLLIDTADASELVNLYYGDLDESTMDTIETVPVDINSLTDFITNTQREIENTAKNSKHEAKLYKNLRQAKYVKIIAEFFYSAFNRHVLPQIPKPSPYGRVYYKGINIQNVSKEVRTAILGDHYVYDLNAAVYAIKLMMIKTIMRENGMDDFGHFTYTKEYLDYKNQIRKKLARHITAYKDGEKLVKEAITAIGFGARIGGGSWLVDGEWQTSSIEDIIMNPEDRKNFTNDPWVKEFVREQEKMTSIIAEYYIESEGFLESVVTVPNMHKNGKIRKTQVMSYVFQHAEKNIMDLITKNIPVVARVHDSFITKKKLGIDAMKEIKYQLNKLESLMTIECEEFHRWIDVVENDYEYSESDIDEAFSKLTGVKHKTPVVKMQHTYQPKTIEGYADSACAYGQLDEEYEL